MPAKKVLPCRSQEIPKKLANGAGFAEKTPDLWVQMKLFLLKIDFQDVDKLHKKFESDISKIVDFFLLSNFWWYIQRLIPNFQDH